MCHIKPMMTTFLLSFLLLACAESGNGGNNGASARNGGGADSSGSGQAGSMARFSVVNNMLYALSGSNLQLIDVAIPEAPALWNRVPVQFDIETLFAYGPYLFIGSRSGVYIYDNTDPFFPTYLSQFTHARSCDPVVVQGHYAYVTLRGNSRCRGGQNQLDILDITNVAKPVLTRTYPMQEPFGLGISDDTLFICDGRAGLKVFDVKDKTAISIKETYSDVNCYDLIPNNGVLLVSADIGLLQFDYRGTELVPLSEIKITINNKI